jgi:hypothetical protein
MIFNAILNNKKLSINKTFINVVYLKANRASNGIKIILYNLELTEFLSIKVDFFNFLEKQLYLEYFVFNKI